MTVGLARAALTGVYHPATFVFSQFSDPGKACVGLILGMFTLLGAFYLFSGAFIPGAILKAQRKRASCQASPDKAIHADLL